MYFTLWCISMHPYPYHIFMHGIQQSIEFKWRSQNVTIAGLLRQTCFLHQPCLLFHFIWAASWQNQQSGWYAPNEDSDQPVHPPSLIRAFTVRSMGSLGSNLSSCGQRRLWSDWADAQADLILRWALIHFVGFVMSRLICRCRQTKTNKGALMTVFMRTSFLSSFLDQVWKLIGLWMNERYRETLD